MSVAAQFEANASEDLSSPFYFNASHWRAMDGVVEGVKAREGIMVMTGPTGSGKTMLMRAISDNLGEGVTPLFLQYASLNFREFVNFLHNSLNVGDEVLDASNKAVALRKFLYAQAERHETAVVFVDEAQNLEPDVLRMLPKLACFDQLEDGTNVGLQFMLTGGSELREVLDDTDFNEVENAIARKYELRFFTREELKYFLEKRLAPLARLTPEPITDSAIEAVGKYTGGSPRLIGMICSHAMLFAAENPGRSIDESMIEEAAEALMIEPVENPFAHEDEDSSDLSGPFSSADLRGDDAAEQSFAADRQDESEPASMEATIGGTVDDSYEDDSLNEESVTNFAEEADAVDSPYMADVMDEMGKGLDVEPIGEYLNDADMDEDDFHVPAAAKVAAPVAAASVMGRVKSAFSRGGRKSADKTHIVGAGRKGRDAQRTAEPTEKRAMKTRVVGQRQKRVKYALYAAAFSGLVFGVYMVRTDVTKVLASAAESVSSGASSAVDKVATAGSRASESLGSLKLEKPESVAIEAPTLPASTDVAALDIKSPPIAPTEPVVQAPSSGGWGAKVEVNKPGSVKLPERGVGLAQGALDLLDSALDKGKEVLPEDMGAAIDVAKADVKGLRTTASTNGASGEELKSRIAKLVGDGNDYFERKLYIAPARGNAYDSYRAALDIDPQNQAALRGIEDLRAFYSAKAEAARAKKQWDNANRFFETALRISQRKSVR